LSVEPAGPLVDPIEITELCSRYGEMRVLERITLTVRPGETVGLIGLNGAGKTTLLKSILMLMRPLAGTVRLFGEPHESPSSRARLAYLPEKFQPPGHLCGLDFVRMTLAFHHRSARRAAISVRAEQLDLDPSVLNRRIRTYSKGMAQKLGLLATLMTDLPLLILDEPMSGLDPKARMRLKQQLAGCRARGQAVFLSSHILADHDELCDRIAILHRGRLDYVGSPAQLKEREKAATLETAFLTAIEDAPSPKPLAEALNG